MMSWNVSMRSLRILRIDPPFYVKCGSSRRSAGASHLFNRRNFDFTVLQVKINERVHFQSIKGSPMPPFCTFSTVMAWPTGPITRSPQVGHVPAPSRPAAGSQLPVYTASPASSCGSLSRRNQITSPWFSTRAKPFATRCMRTIRAPAPRCRMTCAPR